MLNFLTNTLLVNWKTTAAGILTMLVGVTGLFGVTIAGSMPMSSQAAIGLIVAGLTGLAASDAGTAPVTLVPTPTPVQGT